MTEQRGNSNDSKNADILRRLTTAKSPLEIATSFGELLNLLSPPETVQDHNEVKDIKDLYLAYLERQYKRRNGQS